MGTVLGLLDGLSAFLYPEAAAMMAAIMIGSIIKGLVTGVIMGLVARRWKSLPLGIVVGLVLGLGLSFLAAMQPDPSGRHGRAARRMRGRHTGDLAGHTGGHGTICTRAIS